MKATGFPPDDQAMNPARKYVSRGTCEAVTTGSPGPSARTTTISPSPSPLGDHAKKARNLPSGDHTSHATSPAGGGVIACGSVPSAFATNRLALDEPLGAAYASFGSFGE